MAKSSGSGCGSTFVFIVVMFLLVALVKGCDFVTDKFGGEKKEEEQKTYFVDGGKGTILNNGFAAVDKDSYKELINNAYNNNTEALRNMLANGRIFIVDQGETVTIVDYGINKILIEVDTTGERGYVTKENVEPKE